mmetsp:Transcript_18397/g.24278  ORF Transcript_18397/g.24278 Transcript_18397/m.24278 type:complete len:372 (+) Transcript_18397:75-1190(+)|eukprot:CAMPEP_0117751304 /NCGR_PEP_ID=MMETSP0947-20121206/10890_1 /TAXON_ID=44440 /ORGANISM="Chattonella subsalsa, Strain CCMP2191" /LENGTH=371 /DNA_ID=CAMNT_0005569649 /DNA_START=73 /DNA_END=1188 /DNA_ORIENTATION=+
MKVLRFLFLVACLLGTASALSVAPKSTSSVSLSQVNKSLQNANVAEMSEAKAEAVSVRGGLSDDLQQRLKVGVYFSLWYALNIGYNIYNKKALNIIPAPWTVATIQMIVGVFVFVPMWILRVRKAPVLSKENIKTLFPIGACHTLGHVSGVISLGAGAVSFTHIVKAAEPLFTALFSAVLLSQFFAWQVYMTLLPVIIGVGLASLKELSFSWTSFGGAMTSNVACALRGVFAKVSMGKPQGKNMNASNLYSVLTIMACVLLTPVALALEGSKLSSAWDSALATGTDSKTIIIWTLLSGFFYYTYNEVAFLALDSVHPITHAVGNTIKRVVIIITSMIVFKTTMTPLGALGSTIAILGVLAYSLAKNAFDKK